MEWRRIDLHIHTPASKDYQEPGATYLDILKKAESEGLDIIAFTDHNTIAGYAAMKQEISDLERWQADGRLRPEEKARLEEYRRLLNKILVLPGFEFTATFGFHILAIFDQSVPIRTIEHVLLKLNVPLDALDEGATEVGATSDVLTAYRVMAESGALVIAAHANSSNGVAMFGFGFGGQTKIAYTQDPNLHALEVTDLESTKKRRTASFFNGSKPEYPRRMHCIQGSDANRVRGLPNSRNLGVGERATEVLLPEVSFKALKELFLSDDFSRTRPARRTAETFDELEMARKEGPTIVQSFHEQMTQRGGRLHAILCDVVAFANTNGGTIYVGVSSNPKVPPKGIESPQAAMDELRKEIERMVTPPLNVSLSVLSSRGKSIVRISVPKGDDIPYVLEGSRIYLRREGETYLAMRDEIVALIRRALQGQGEITFQERPTAPAATIVPAAPVPKAMPQPVFAEQPPATQAVAPMAAQEEESALIVPPPRTGVEIIASEERDGVLYHTMRDLRDGDKVHNVTHASARKLWRYAIALREKHHFQEDKVTWHAVPTARPTMGELPAEQTSKQPEEKLGLWHKYLRSGRPHYDLVQKGADGKVHIYYGVTEDGIHGPWRAVVGMED